MKVKLLRSDRGVDKKITILVGEESTVWVDYDDVDHDEAERIADIIVKALKEAEEEV